MAENAVYMERDEIIMKVRFDFRGTAKGKHLFFGFRDTSKIALENRERNVALLKNLPVQGVKIEQINTELEPYNIYEEEEEEWVTYAPVEVIIRAYSLEDTLRFILREELRKIEILNPQRMVLDDYKIEHFFVRLHNEMKSAINTAIRQQGRK